MVDPKSAARGGGALSRFARWLFTPVPWLKPFAEDSLITRDPERQLRTRSAAAAVLLAGLGAAWLMRPWREPQGSAYWEAKPLGALAWLLGVVIVAGLATAATARIPTREAMPRRVALVMLFLTFGFVGLAVSPLF